MPKAVAAAVRRMAMGRAGVMIAVGGGLSWDGPMEDLRHHLTSGGARVEQVGRGASRAEGQRKEESEAGTYAGEHCRQSWSREPESASVRGGRWGGHSCGRCPPSSAAPARDRVVSGSEIPRGHLARAEGRHGLSVARSKDSGERGGTHDQHRTRTTGALASPVQGRSSLRDGDRPCRLPRLRLTGPLSLLGVCPGGDRGAPLGDPSRPWRSS